MPQEPFLFADTVHANLTYDDPERSSDQAWAAAHAADLGDTLAHGAGAGMRHHFMEAMALRLAKLGIATLRYQFPYMEAGRKAPDVPRKLTATVRAAGGTGGV